MKMSKGVWATLDFISNEGKEVLCVDRVDLFSFLGYPDTFLKAKFATCHDISVLITLANYLWADLN